MPVPAESEGPVPPRRLLTDDVFDRLRDDIVRGRLEPGQRLHDVSLAAELGISRATLRTVLLRLHDLGLVDAVPNLYTRVAPIDLDRFADATDTARALYLFAARVGTPLLDDARRAQMKAWLDDRDLGAEPERIFSGHTAAALLQLFVDALDNAPLKRTLARLAPHLRRVVGLYAHLLPLDEVDAGLTAVVEAALRHDPEAVSSHLAAYFDGPLRVFHDRLRRELTTDTPEGGALRS